MPEIRQGNVGTNDVNLSLQMYFDAKGKEQTFSQLLEEMSPTQPGDSLTAFERQLKRFNIRTKDDLSTGMPASTVEEFLNPKFATTGIATDAPTPSVSARILFPEYINNVARIAKTASYNVNSLVSENIGINADTYRSTTITITPANVRRGRVGERGAFPIATIDQSQSATVLKKYGVQFEATYEALRRMRLPMLDILIAGSMKQNENDQFAAALDCLINGDGNSNGATSYNLTTCDSGASAGTVTYKGWLAFLAKLDPYKANVVVGNLNSLLQVILMTKPSVDPIQLLTTMDLSKTGQSIRFENTPWGDLTFIFYNSSDIDYKLIALDKTFSIVRLYEIGADLQETERIITQQFERIVVSDVEGYNKMFQPASAILYWNA